MIRNPVLRGFHPDPSILRVGDDYFIAVSTFQWFPGVLIYHSKDLEHWKFMAAPLNRISQLDLRGIPDSCGIFAPCLSYSERKFYLVYTVVKTDSVFQDTDNYLVTTEDLQADWSDPIWLNSTGFDPSLFHDNDGRKWLLNRDCDTRGYLESRGGILMREYDEQKQCLTGPEYRIYRDPDGIGAEGPHLYRYGGYYYLITAEGGTDYNHMTCVARSREITGPYELCPYNPILTSREDPWNPLQKAGHASLVNTQSGEWYIAHLVGRPIPTKGTCILGRETAIQKVEWTKDGWMQLSHGTREPLMKVPGPDIHGVPDLPGKKKFSRDDFDRQILGYPYQTLRVPIDPKVITLTERKGVLRIYGRDSLHSKYDQALVARRQQAFCCKAETCIEYSPENYHQTAGLICMYDTDNFFYLYITRDEAGKKRLGIMVSDLGQISYPVGEGAEIPEGCPVCLRAVIENDRMHFEYASAGKAYQRIGRVFDYSILSDDYYYQRGSYRFTGAFLGMCCQDCYDRKSFADFHYFIYEEYPEERGTGI